MSADLAVVGDPTVVSPADIQAASPEVRGQMVAQALTESKAWLAVAQRGTDPRPIAEFRAWAEGVEHVTRALGLAKEIQLDAQELVRRAERGLGLTIRAGQANGTVARQGENLGEAKVSTQEVSGLDHAALSERVYPLTDDVTDEQFAEAVAEARAEEKPTRANVVRKIKGEKNATLTTTQKVERIRSMATEGYRSAQIAHEIGVSEKWVRELARDNGIEITADKVAGRTRRIDSNQVVAEIVASVAELALPMRLVNFADLDAARADEWANSLTDSIRALNRFTKQIKELAQ